MRSTRFCVANRGAPPDVPRFCRRRLVGRQRAAQAARRAGDGAASVIHAAAGDLSATRPQCSGTPLARFQPRLYAQLPQHAQGQGAGEAGERRRAMRAPGGGRMRAPWTSSTRYIPGRCTVSGRTTTGAAPRVKPWLRHHGSDLLINACNDPFSTNPLPSASELVCGNPVQKRPTVAGHGSS